MSDWVAIADAMPDHPKMLALDADYLAGFSLCICAITWSDDHGTDGLIPRLALTRVCPGITDAEEAQRIAERLVAVGLFEAHGGDYLIHDFADFQRSKAEKDALRRVRSEAGRKGGLATQARAKASASSNGSSTDRHTDIHTEREGTARKYAPPLPQCLDTDAGYRDELKGFTYAQVIMHDAEAKFAPWSGLDQSAFRAIFHRTCFRDCSRSPRQVEHCADVTLKAIEKANDSWPASKSLVTRILEQDRRDVEVAS